MNFMGLLSRLGLRRSPLEEGTKTISKEEALASYIIREHKQGRAIGDILGDAYLKNRTTDDQRVRLLQRPEVIRAVGENTAAAAEEQLRAN